ncbi:MAG: hypothetical protein IJM38_09245 [Ruminococcus sp.]|uniref:hypothetical protein n=1 Tax=Ruminococcus flavefaciens TaxID=1265 RepID=UPI0026ED0EE6|nr:hypothetical protein [Ruminococcus flavefaciens]MBQ9895552.1 hypothetical protein [Ruminococcus sp.]
MKLDKIIDFFSNAETGDLILTGTILFILIITICGNLYVIFNIKRWLKKLENEITISNRHLAHLDPNKYPESRDNYYQ